LVKQNKSIDIYNNAQTYSKIAKYVNQSGDRSFLIPSQVIAALSLELHFKSLFYLETESDFKINGRYSHDFYFLFKELSDESKKEIKCDFETAIKNRNMNDVKLMEKQIHTKISLGFFDNLKIWSTIFTEVRYLYEEKAKQSMMFFPEFEQAIVARINKIINTK